MVYFPARHIWLQGGVPSFYGGESNACRYLSQEPKVCEPTLWWELVEAGSRGPAGRGWDTASVWNGIWRFPFNGVAQIGGFQKKIRVKPCKKPVPSDWNHPFLIWRALWRYMPYAQHALWFLWGKYPPAPGKVAVTCMRFRRESHEWLFSLR